MPCLKLDHTHNWPTEGPLTIERCERFCNFCDGADAKHSWKFAWFLRRHVKAVHIQSGQYPNIEMAEGWTRAEGGHPRRSNGAAKKKAPARRSRKVIESPISSPEPSEALSSPSQASVDLNDMGAKHHGRSLSIGESIQVATGAELLHQSFNDASSSSQASLMSDVHSTGAVNHQDPFTVPQPYGGDAYSSPSQASVEHGNIPTGDVNVQDTSTAYPYEDVHSSSSHASVVYNTLPTGVADFQGAFGFAQPQEDVHSSPSQTSLIYEDFPAGAINLQGDYEDIPTGAIDLQGDYGLNLPFDETVTDHMLP
ncbi:hypothetical protein LTR36_010691 [Oleoguttula mirabilis]|uniref:Uncharacterized protein n=1 Tax=Oleoguttula mirabilis TaxID=1507867 RepID=A0AAV9JSI9_9PEZI|nr:hypothetical protein LTR36_010691 [Oleoguttula mirabilis]